MRLIAVLGASSLLIACPDSSSACGVERVAASSVTGCLQTDFARFTCPHGLDIPDDDGHGVTLDAIRIPSGRLMVDRLLVEIDITHPYSGDLELVLYCDRNGDGEIDGAHELEIHEVVDNPCGKHVAEACPVTLDGLHFFWVSVVDPPEPGPQQCRFELRVTDDMGDDAGTVRSWTLYVPLRPTSDMTPGEGSDVNMEL